MARRNSRRLVDGRKVTHPAYWQIIGLGLETIPILLRELKERPDHWFLALRALTGLNPASPNDAGRLPVRVESWLEWG